MRVLLIEDEKEISDVIEESLTSEKIFCVTINSAENYSNKILSSQKEGDCFDLVILDLHLPGSINGYDILLRLRNAKIKVPVLILSCIAAVKDKIRALSFGADDYLTKPFYKHELVARIKAIIRRTKGHPESTIRIGNIAINFDHRIVKVKDKTVHLTNKEYATIELLALRKGSVLTKEMFLNHLYNGLDEPSDNKIVDVFMCKLRKKLEKANDGKSHIETVWGRGYILKDYEEEEFTHHTENESIDYEKEDISINIQNQNEIKEKGSRHIGNVAKKIAPFEQKDQDNKGLHNMKEKVTATSDE